MALENLKENLKIEKELIKEILIFSSQLSSLDEGKRLEINILQSALNSSLKKLKIINNSIPAILNSISPFKRLSGEKEEVKGLVQLSYAPETEKRVGAERFSVTIEKKRKEEFLKELSLSKETLKRLQKKGKIKKEEPEFMEFKKSNWYARFSNKFFLNLSTRFLNQGKLKKLNSNLRKANMPFLVTTYLSMVFLSTILAFFLGILIFLVFLAFTMNLVSVLRNLLIIIALPLIAFFSLYYYPYVEGKSIEGKINNELPFVTIHMSAIAGSGIEPSQIFKIIALGEEYPNTKKEFKKIINQVNVYGYDLITALKNTARETSSSRLSELLNGIATTISGGGSLSEFLDKRAETLLFNYRLEREKKTKSAETFMDIYISIVIAAPMILTLLLILISITGISIGLSLNVLTMLIISIVTLINIIFLVFLHLRQPAY